jgi:hypothetical protein
MITREQAIEIARREAARNGWPFLEPVRSTYDSYWFRPGGLWCVHTNSEMRGANAVFQIDEHTGKVEHKGYNRR